MKYKSVLDSVSDIDVASSTAISIAKRRLSAEVSPDDLLLGCLYVKSRFGIAQIGSWTFDLEVLGVDWMAVRDKPGDKVSYSEAVVQLFDRAARIAAADGCQAVTVPHLLVAFANEDSSLMGKLKEEFGIQAPAWRAAIADMAPSAAGEEAARPLETSREYLTPEEAAAALNIHVQTLRAYVRSGKLPARRLAGERAIRIRRADLDQVLEPFTSET
jgi:excisionase family DNA binding protein